MKHADQNKKTLTIIVALVLIGAVLAYYLTRQNPERRATPPQTNQLKTDSTTHINRDSAAANMSAKPDINPKDGSVKIVEDFIKSKAKNPSTFEFLEWSNVTTEGAYWKVRCKYKGLASFNAEVTTNAWFYIQNNKVVHTKIISKI